jgi:hypothetical protein
VGGTCDSRWVENQSNDDMSITHGVTIISGASQLSPYSSSASRELEDTDDYSPSRLISSGIDFHEGHVFNKDREYTP